MNDLLVIFAATSLAMAAAPAYFYMRNRSVFRAAPLERSSGSLSVLVPARNEQANIAACLDSVLRAADGVELEIVVLDDGSDDATPEIVREVAARDSRVHLIRGAALPTGWNGKQHACQRLAEQSRHDLLLWIDADVRLEPGALGRMLSQLHTSGADLLSGFPRQITVTWLERLLLPLIHFVLLGFLSLRAMRTSTRPSYAAGCGQLFLTRRAAYECAGGHAAVRASRHDGVTLPRAYRRAGLRTDLFDATDVARCRMYDSSRAVWLGLTKNATEGVATPQLLPMVTVMLMLGQVLPILVLGIAWAFGASIATVLCGVAVLLSIGPRVDAAIRFRQPIDGALLHPIGVLLFLVIQWEAFARERLGRPVPWRGRGVAHSSGHAEPAN